MGWCLYDEKKVDGRLSLYCPHQTTDCPCYKCGYYSKKKPEEMKEINKRLTCIDLFAGAGGFSLGLSHAGFNIVAAVEIDKGTCDTLQANKAKCFPNMLIIERDIRELSGAELLDMVDMKRGELFLLVGSPPCQSFSFANTKNRSLDDPRSKLMFEFIRMVKELQPQAFYIENVPGLFAYKDFFYLLMQSLEECGYVARFLMMDAVSYGVPQHRKRIFIQGARNDIGMLPTFPEPENFDPEALNGSIAKPSRAAVAKKCFQVNGFSKEEIKEVWWNTKFWIMMKKKTVAEKVDQAIIECIAEGMVEILHGKD
ncbi:DNA (cytosine-5-)-methyltransferase [candidate division WOR-3 bacterium]|nr:DNA (cytosine-5-)-methyltransferase [candidate division WOR-3 bacterium]